MLLGNTGFNIYKNITIPDDDLVNPMEISVLEAKVCRLQSGCLRITLMQWCGLRIMKVQTFKFQHNNDDCIVNSN